MYSPSDHGRGYTRCSMRSTPRRWRRRIGVDDHLEVGRIELLGAGGHHTPSRADQLISASGWRRYSGASSHGCTHSSRSAWAWASCTSDRADGWASSGSDDLDAHERPEGRRVPERAVADQQHLLAAGDQLGGQLVGRADLGLGEPLHAAGHLAVERGEHLAPAGVDHRGDEPGAEPGREREQVEARDADHRHPERLGDRLAGGDADPEAR